MPGSSEGDQPAAGEGRRGAADVMGDDRVLVAVHDQHRAAHAAAQLARAAPRIRPGTSAAISVSAIGVEAPGDAVLDLLGRVRLGEHLREEELDKPGVVAPPGVCVVSSPAVSSAPVSTSNAGGGFALGAERKAEVERGADQHEAAHPVGVLAGQHQRALGAQR